MFTLDKKISLPLLVAFLGAAIGALSGQFVWVLVTALSLWALAYVAQNVSSILRSINTRGQTTVVEPDSGISHSLDGGSDWLKKWSEDMDYCPTYKGTPGNIWRGPKWTSDD